MRKLHLLSVLLLSAAVSAQSVGKMLPNADITGLSNTKAKTLSEFAGRTLLLEFFAYT